MLLLSPNLSMSSVTQHLANPNHVVVLEFQWGEDSYDIIYVIVTFIVIT